MGRYLLYALLLWAPLASGAYRGWSLAGAELLALAGMLAWTAEMLHSRRLEWRRTALDLPLAGLIALVLLQLALGNRPLASWALAPPGASLDVALPGPLFTLGTVSPTQTARSLVLLLTYAAVYVLVVNLIRERHQLDRLVRVLLSFGGVLAFVALLDYLAGNASIITWRESPLQGRLSGTFVNPDHFAAWLAMLVCLGLGYLSARRRPPGEGVPLRRLLASREGREHMVRRYLPVVAIGVMALALIFTLSRGGVVSLLLALVALLGLLGVCGLTRWSLLTTGALGAAVIGYGAWVGLEPFLARVRAGPLDYASRWVQTLTTLPMLALSPVFGVGLGAYKDVYFRYQPPALSPGKVYFPYAHNDLLQLVVELGLAGTMVVLFAAWRVGADLVGAHFLGQGRCPVGTEEKPARRQDPFSVGIALGGLGAVLALVFDSLFDFSARIPANGILAAACLGIATVALHTRFSDEPQTLTKVRARSLGTGKLLPLVLAVACLAVSAAVVAGIVRPALVEATFQETEARDRSRAVEDALALDPRDVRALAERARLRLDGARQVWYTGITLDGQLAVSAEAQTREAAALLDGAVQDLRTALSLTPSDPFLHERLAWAYGTARSIDSPRASELLAAALAHFRRAIALAPENPFLYRSLAAFAAAQERALLAVGLRAGREAIQRSPDLLPDLVDRFLPVGLSVDQWMELVPPAGLDRLQLASLLEARGRVHEAEAVYRRAVEVASPDERPLSHWLLAQLLIRGNDYRGAQAEVEGALRDDPDNPELHLARAQVLAAEGSSSALDAYRAAIAKAERRAQRTGRDQSLFQVRTPRAQALVAERFRGAGGLTPIRYRVALGLYLNDRALWTEALRVWDEVVAASPSDALARFSRGVALDHLGARDEALESYRRAVALDGGTARFRLRLAESLWTRDQYYQAIGEWRAVVAQDAGNVEARLALARAYVRVGDRDAALAEYELLRELAPDHPDVRGGLARLRGHSLDSTEGENAGRR